MKATGVAGRQSHSAAFPLVVLDAMGVLYRAGDDVADVLVPYCRRLGCGLADADIARVYHRASVGELTSAQLWQACGVRGDDEEYCSFHELTPGIDTWLQSMRDQGVLLACLSNDVSEWSMILRRRFGLERWIDTWIISGDIGVRKPDPAAFHAVESATGVALDRMVFFDDREPNVAAARRLGMAAHLFTGVHDAAGRLGLSPAGHGQRMKAEGCGGETASHGLNFHN